MAELGCPEAMELMNLVFRVPTILNDGHEIRERLAAGDDIADIVNELIEKFGRKGAARRLRPVFGSWPPLHLEAVAQVVGWALGKLDTEERIAIEWKGTADHRETVTRFEVRDHTLLIEFAHPPAAVRAAATA
jgi:hypothetical protein